MIRVLIVDDHQLMRQGICALLMKAQDVKIVDEALLLHRALRMAERLTPDVVLMDIEMPRMDGLEATRRLVAADKATKVLMLSMKNDEMDVARAAELGARGYLIKNSNREELIDAVRTVYRGGCAASPEVAMYFRSESLS